VAGAHGRLFHVAGPFGIALEVEDDLPAPLGRGGDEGGLGGAVMVTLGTGIGGGIVMGGRLQRGAHGFAGEMGHMIVERDGIACPCGLRGCWERYASGSALGDPATGPTGEQIVAAARGGDATAIARIEEFAGWVAIGLASLVNLCDPLVVVLGGGVIGSRDTVMPSVRTKFGEALYSAEARPHPRLEAAVLGERAGAIGAALLASAPV
ncbi:MAG: ROK family protein, partial [Actinomycetota bacterium]